jgi:hypothetical protein
MKKFRLLILLVAFAAATTACHFGRHTVIVETGNNHYLKIESYGKVYFNNDETGVAYVSRSGYLTFQDNDKHLKAENDGHNGVKYEIDIDGRPVDPQTEGKAFIAHAVRVMISKGYRSN